MDIKLLKEKNPNLKFHEVYSDEFRKYGRVITDFDFSSMIKYMEEHTTVPQEGNVYVPSVVELESLKGAQEIQEVYYGEMPIQIGYCNGVNSRLNGLEYHKGSEINIAVTEFVLLLGSLQDVENNTFCSSKVEAFYVPKGAAIELYQTTLHFAPCKLCIDGFKCIVILPRGTNEPLKNMVDICSNGEKRLLFAKNKWLLAHPDRMVLTEKGAIGGIVGDNIEVIF